MLLCLTREKIEWEKAAGGEDEKSGGGSGELDEEPEDAYGALCIEGGTMMNAVKSLL